MNMILFSFWLFCIITLGTSVYGAHWHFTEWYSAQEGLERVAQHHCKEVLELYLNPNLSCPNSTTSHKALSWDKIGSRFKPRHHCIQLHNVVDCILTHTSESAKARLSTGTTLIGLLPTILGLAGSSAAEIGLLSQRRPMLALLLSVASPVLNPIRTHQYQQPIKAVLLDGERSLTLPGSTVSSSIYIISGLQYLLAIGLGFNIMTALRDLIVRTVMGISEELFWLPALWALIGIMIQVLGVMAFTLRFRVNKKMTWMKEEVTPSAHQEKANLHLRKESYSFVMCAWLTSVLAFLHILFGTAMFSTILLLPMESAVVFAVRLLTCTVFSRIILMWELTGMRQSLSVELGNTLEHSIKAP